MPSPGPFDLKMAPLTNTRSKLTLASDTYFSPSEHVISEGEPVQFSFVTLKLFIPSNTKGKKRGSSKATYKIIPGTRKEKHFMVFQLNVNSTQLLILPMVLYMLKKIMKYS